MDSKRDYDYYARIEVPAPTLSPQERQRRRLAWRNERTLHRRNCDATGRKIISIYDSSVPFPVYDQDYWWSDKWDPKQYGRDFDFTRPFFDQFRDLHDVVPQISLQAYANENSEYVNLSSWSKDCYLTFESDNNRECLYCDHTFRCTTCLDVSYCNECELCHECVWCRNCYNSSFLFHSLNCSDSVFLKNCIGCKNCFFGVNLRNQEYCFFNEALPPDKYRAKVKEFFIEHQQNYAQMLRTFEQLSRQYPQKYYAGRQNENVTGNYITNSKDCEECYDGHALRDCKWVCNCENAKDCYDVDIYGGERGMQLIYDCHCAGNGAERIYFSNCLFEDTSDVYYSDFCSHVTNLFGCISLRHSNYCILNRQYSKDDYVVLKDKIIQHMQSTGEWGEFFPMTLSPFCYNDTMAHEYYPLEKGEALALGLKWRDGGVPIEVEGKKLQPSTNVRRDESIISSVLECRGCKKPYTIQKIEFHFYEGRDLPIPDACHQCRYTERMRHRDTRKLWERECANCKTLLQSPYSQQACPSVLCEKCYEYLT